MGRWYKQQCDLFDREWANDAKTVSVYVYLHCHAYVQQKKWHGIVIRRGSCPTSRAAIIEATGLSEQEVKSRLRKLEAYGEIIIKRTNQGNIITVCDYESYNVEEGLFGFTPTNEEPTQEPTKTPSSNPPILLSNIYNRQKNEDNMLRSNFVPSKQERESDDVAYEIKKQYNKTFDGVLPEWKRLTKDMVIKIHTCIGRYGRQSVDMVFEQILNEPFSLGEGKNKTGFIANHSFIFELKNYEAYLSRYELRQKKQQKPAEMSAGTTAQGAQGTGTQTEPKASNGSWLDALEENENWKPKTK